MDNEELDDKTIVVPRGQVDDATIVVPRGKALDDATIVVPRGQVLDDATIVVPRDQIDDATITFDKPIDENTVSSASGQIASELPAVPQRASEIQVPEEPEVDAVLEIETYVDPEEEIKKTKIQKVDGGTSPLSTPKIAPKNDGPKVSLLHEAQQQMKKNKVRSASYSKTALIVAISGAVIIGSTLAFLLLK